MPIDNLASGFRSSNKLNDNFQDIQAGFENTLSRDGTGPNQMLAPLDMNSQRIINLPEPISPSDAARLQDVIEAAGGQDFLSKNLNLSDINDPSTARINLGLGQVNNTADLAKPISTLTQTALDLKAPKASPTFTGSVTLPGPGTDPLNPVTRAQLDAAVIGAGAGAVTSVNGSTGVVVLSKASLSLGNVDNTADTAKPVSTAQQTALNLKFNIAGGTLTGQIGFHDTDNPVVLERAAGNSSYTRYSSGTNARWQVGRDASDNFAFLRYTGASVYQDNPLTLINSTGQVVIGAGGLAVGGTVSAVTPTLSTHLATKGYVDSVVSNPSGFFTAQRSGGTIDLTGYAGKTVKITTGVSGDNNIWEILGLSPGQRVTAKVDSNFSFLTTPPGFYAGSCVINGNWLPDAMGLTQLAVNVKDTVEILCTAVNTYEVSLSLNQMFGRASWAGSNREPQETYATIGFVGPYDSTHGLPFGDFVSPINGTAGKPITKGLICRGAGDTAAIFLETYDTADAATDPYTTGSYLKPWSNVGKIGNHITFRTGWNDGTQVPSFTYTMPTGYGGPGSLGQGFHSQIDFYATALPTGTSTPGGFTLRATRPGTPTPIDVANVSPDGGFWAYGKVALEAGALGAASSAAALAALGSGLTLSNIGQWHAPSLLVDRNANGYANINIPVSPAESGLCNTYGAIAMRHYNDLNAGSDFFYRSDEGILWWGSVAGNSRTRVIGTSSASPGVLMHGDGGKSQSVYKTVADDQSFKWTIGSNQSGRAAITLEDGTWLDVAFSTGTTAINKTTTGSSFFDVASGTASAASGTDTHVIVYCDSTGISISNRRGSSQNFRIKFDYA